MERNLLWSAIGSLVVLVDFINQWFQSSKVEQPSKERLLLCLFADCPDGRVRPCLFAHLYDQKIQKGESWHTAEWPNKSKISLKGKKIGMIGNGASAVQILPHLLDEAEVGFIDTISSLEAELGGHRFHAVSMSTVDSPRPRHGLKKVVFKILSAS